MSENRPTSRVRFFPEFDSVNGIEDDLFSILPEDKDNYLFTLLSRWHELHIRYTPREDIDRMLKLFGLPCSQFIAWNHEVVEEDDLDSKLDLDDHGTYRLLVRISRDEFAHYYEMLTGADYVQANFGYLRWEWLWRDLPTPPFSERPVVMVFEKQINRYSVATPLTKTKMRQLFVDSFPDTPTDQKLELLFTSNGRLYITDDCPFGHRVELNLDHYELSTDPFHFLYGYRMRPVRTSSATYPL